MHDRPGSKAGSARDSTSRSGPRCPFPRGPRRRRLSTPQERVRAVERANLASRRWDAEYGRGRYAGEPPIKFAETVLEIVAGSAGLSGGRGLYVGCGNGRNFARLVRGGLDLAGIDPSPVAIGQLAARCPPAAGRLQCVDMERFEPGARFDYLIAIQVFQHGCAASAARYFERASQPATERRRAVPARKLCVYRRLFRPPRKGDDGRRQLYRPVPAGPREGHRTCTSPGGILSDTSCAPASRSRPGRTRIGSSARRQRPGRSRSGRRRPARRDRRSADPARGRQRGRVL